MKNQEIFTLNDSELWTRLLESCKQSDIHFTPEYMKIFEDHVGGKAQLFVERLGKNFLIYPFFLRRINDLPFFKKLDENYFDIISPWYFGGPLISSDENKTELLKNFLSNFHSFCEKNNIVTEFSRLFPISDFSETFANLVNADYRYDAAYIDLTQSLDSIWKNFKKSNRNSITAAERRDVKVEISNSNESLENFFVLYNQSMDRLHAGNFYKFPLSFFQNIMNTLKGSVIIATATQQKIPIASSMFLFKYGIVHYWLSGSDSNYWKYYPNNLLLHKTIIWAKEQGNKIILLMGGTSSGLRFFKESFSNTRLKFYTYSKVHDVTVYNKLNEIRESEDKELVGKNLNFFPLYRR